MLKAADRRVVSLMFTTLSEERTIDRLETDGEIPAWLEGSLLRTGPAKFEIGDRRVPHWYDGLAMLHRFSFEWGDVSYANRFLRGRSWRAAEEGRIGYREFAVDPCRTLFKRLQSLFAPRSTMTDNAIVNIARLGDEFLAMTETPLAVSFDPKTLETLGVARPRPGMIPTAHPHHDAARGELLGYTTDIGLRNRYRLYSQAPGRKARTLASVTARQPSYMHSFAVTERYAVLVAQPFVLQALDLALVRRPFIESFRWEPERGTAFHVIDRHAGRHVGTWHGEPFFFFHTVNAYERGNELVVDVVAWEDASVIDGLYLERMASIGPQLPQNQLLRCRIDLSGNREARLETLASTAMEMPRVNYGRCNGRPYRWVWGAGAGASQDWIDAQILKVDVSTGESISWSQPATFPGEPIFVPAPHPAGEDDGVLLSVVLAGEGDSCFLVVLDAATLEELGRAKVPHHIPAGLHGDFFAGEELRPATALG